MEMEAAKMEHGSLESQLDALKKQINNLTLEVDSCKTMVHPVYTDNN